MSLRTTSPRAAVVERLEARSLLSVSLDGAPGINAYTNVGFRLNPVASLFGSSNGSPDATPSHYQALVNFGDSSLWYKATIISAGAGTSELIVKASHIYTAAGSYQISVSVLGPDASRATQSTTVAHISNLPSPPSLPGSEPYQYTRSRPPSNVDLWMTGDPAISAYVGVGFERNSVTHFSGHLNGTIDANVADYHAQIDWGDGTGWSSATIVDSQVTPGTIEAQGSHRYTKPGSYPIVVYLSGPDGTSFTASPTVAHVVYMPSPKYPVGTTPALPAEPAPVSDVSLYMTSEAAINSYDGVGFRLNPVAQIMSRVANQADNASSHFKAYVNWGDGSQWSTAGIVDSQYGTEPMLVKASHTYISSGTFPIVVLLLGPGGQTIATNTSVAHVYDLPSPQSHPARQPAQQTSTRALSNESLSLLSANSITLKLGQSLSNAVIGGIEGYYGEPANMITSGFRAQVNWGDSPSWSSASVVPGKSLLETPFDVRGSHSYGQVGTYVVVLYVTAPDGQTISGMTTVVHVVY